MTPNPIFEVIALDDDQPATCPQCGARTEFESTAEGIELHRCLDSHCGYEFLAVFEVAS